MILTDGALSITIPDSEFWWSNELEFEPVLQTTERTVTGALVVDQWPQDAGRPITLSPHTDRHGWLPRADWLVLDTWRATPGKTLTLTGLGASRPVIFGRPALEAAPVYQTDRDDSEYWRGTLRLLEI